MPLLVARRNNNRKVVGSRPNKVPVVCITELSAVTGRHSFFRAVGSWSWLSALMDSDLSWLNVKSGRQSSCYCYANAFQRSIMSGAIYHFTIPLALRMWCQHSRCKHAAYMYLLKRPLNRLFSQSIQLKNRDIVKCVICFDSQYSCQY